MNRASVGVLLVLLLGGVSWAQQEGVLFTADFEKDTCGFTTLDKEATLSVTHEADLVFKGKGSLQFAYPQRAVKDGPDAEKTAALMLHFPTAYKDLKTISFAVATFHSTPLAVFVSEGDAGPRYMAIIWCEAGDWHRCTLPLDRFRLVQDGPPDPVGKIVPEKVTGLLILDLGLLLRSEGEREPGLYQAPPEDQTLWLDDFKLLSTAPAPLPEPADGVRLSSYKAPPLGVILLGGKSVTLTDEDDDQGGKALKLEYTLPAHTVLVQGQFLPPDTPPTFTALRFRAKSSGDVTLVLRLQYRGGNPRDVQGFSTMLTVKGMKPWQTITVPVADLKPEGGPGQAGGPAVPAQKVDLSKVDTILLIDLSAAGGDNQIRNTLWLDDMVAVK